MIKKERNRFVKLLLKNWWETRKLTLDWLSSSSIKSLNKKLPRIGLDTFAKQILEMADVEKAYSNSLNGKALDFSDVTDGMDIENNVSKSKLLKKLTDADRIFEKAVIKVVNWDELIQIFDQKLPKYSVLELYPTNSSLQPLSG